MKIQELKDYRLLNVKTGEIDSFNITIKKEHRGGHWMIVEQGAMEFLAGKQLHGESLRVLLKLVAKAGFQNILPSPKRVAKALNMKATNVNRAFRELIACSAVVKEDEVYLLNPRFYWKGTNKQRKETIARLESEGIRL